MNLTRGINLRKVAEMMPGASGAEVKVWRYRRGFNEHLHVLKLIGNILKSTTFIYNLYLISLNSFINSIN